MRGISAAPGRTLSGMIYVKAGSKVLESDRLAPLYRGHFSIGFRAPDHPGKMRIHAAFVPDHASAATGSWSAGMKLNVR